MSFRHRPRNIRPGSWRAVIGAIISLETTCFRLSSYRNDVESMSNASLFVSRSTLAPTSTLETIWFRKRRRCTYLSRILAPARREGPAAAAAVPYAALPAGCHEGPAVPHAAVHRGGSLPAPVPHAGRDGYHTVRLLRPVRPSTGAVRSTVHYSQRAGGGWWWALC